MYLTSHAVVLEFEEDRYRSRPGASCDIVHKLTAQIAVDRKPVNYGNSKLPQWNSKY